VRAYGAPARPRTSVFLHSLGHEPTSTAVGTMSAFARRTDMSEREHQVRKVPIR
jgi:hypothetical protein